MLTRRNKCRTKLLAGTGLALFLFLLCPKTGICVHAGNAVFEKEDGVYLIQSAQDMRTLALLVNNGKEVEPGVAAHNASYRLTRDIDLSPYSKGHGWEPIGRGHEEGAEETDVREFNGTFDGGNHVVTGLYINCPDVDNQGLFGRRTYLYGGADNVEYQDSGRTVIKNLYIKDCDITGGRYVGGVMGGMTITNGLQNAGDLYIENCHVTGKIIGFDSTGGITGAASSVENCSFTGTVEAYSAVGGIAGIAYYIQGCAVHARVVGGLDRPLGGDAGGIGGVAVCVRDSYMTGAVTGTDNVGGITGRGSCLAGCYARADVTGEHYAGELLGFSQRFEGLYLPEDASGEREIKNCLTGAGDITDFQEWLEGSEEAGRDVWFCAADCAYPNMAWEKESRFGYTTTVAVQEGDSLWELAGDIYGDGYLWPLIYEQNQEKIGRNPSLLVPGMDLEITVNVSLAAYASEGEPWLQEKEFLEKGREQGLSKAELQYFYRRLLVDDLWNGIVWKWPGAPQDYSIRINTCVIKDLDGNGQKDMLVMAGEGGGAVPGVIWLYLNGEPAYVLKDENAYYEDYFCFGFGLWNDPVMADIDNDGNQELLFEVFNGGNGGSGGRDICLFRHVENRWTACLQELPSDRDSVIGLHVDVRCTDVDTYEAYCPYLEEHIAFEGENSREISEDEFASGNVGGANVWGFYDFECVPYKGKNALQCREYLSGEGGNAHYVGVAVFILAWDEDGVCRVADWWVEGAKAGCSIEKG